MKPLQYSGHMMKKKGDYFIRPDRNQKNVHWENIRKMWWPKHSSGQLGLYRDLNQLEKKEEAANQLRRPQLR